MIGMNATAPWPNASEPKAVNPAMRPVQERAAASFIADMSSLVFLGENPESDRSLVDAAACDLPTIMTRSVAHDQCPSAYAI